MNGTRDRLHASLEQKNGHECRRTVVSFRRKKDTVSASDAHTLEYNASMDPSLSSSHASLPLESRSILWLRRRSADSRGRIDPSHPGSGTCTLPAEGLPLIAEVWVCGTRRPGSLALRWLHSSADEAVGHALDRFRDRDVSEDAVAEGDFPRLHVRWVRDSAPWPCPVARSRDSVLEEGLWVLPSEILGRETIMGLLWTTEADETTLAQARQCLVHIDHAHAWDAWFHGTSRSLEPLFRTAKQGVLRPSLAGLLGPGAYGAEFPKAASRYAMRAPDYSQRPEGGLVLRFYIPRCLQLRVRWNSERRGLDCLDETDTRVGGTEEGTWSARTGESRLALADRLLRDTIRRCLLVRPWISIATVSEIPWPSSDDSRSRSGGSSGSDMLEGVARESPSESSETEFMVRNMEVCVPFPDRFLWVETLVWPDDASCDWTRYNPLDRRALLL